MNLFEPKSLTKSSLFSKIRKRVRNFSSLFFLCLISVSANTQIKVMSYNIHYGTSMDNKNSINDIADLIKQYDPDIVGLQEISDSIMAAKIGKLTNMRVVFGPSLDNRMNGYGDAILSKYPFEWEGNHSIPSASSSRYQAMAVKIDFSAKSKNLGVVRLINTHFDWLETVGSEHARLATVDVIEDAFFAQQPHLPTILTGDLNSKPESKELLKLEKYGWINPGAGKKLYTCESDNPTMQIDYVLYRPATKWKVKNVYVLENILYSDHLPIMTELILQ